MFTPQEVSEKVFPKASFGSGGYSMASVDEFLDALTEDYTALFKENVTLKAKLKVLAEKVEEYRSTEEAMRQALLTAQKMAKSGKYDAVICLGAVIRGATSHYDLVCNEAAKGIAQVGLQTGVPIMFGVVTTENIEQAIERAGTKAGNKGYDCALSVIETVNLLKAL